MSRPLGWVLGEAGRDWLLVLVLLGLTELVKLALVGVADGEGERERPWKEWAVWMEGGARPDFGGVG